MSDPANLTSDDNDLLWPPIEKWERSGHAADLEALRTVMDQVWEARRPDWEYYEGEDEATSEGSCKSPGAGGEDSRDIA